MDKTDIEISHRNIIGGSKLDLEYSNYRFWNNMDDRFDEIEYSWNTTVIMRNNIIDLVWKIAGMANINRIKERIESNDKRRRKIRKNS